MEELAEVYQKAIDSEIAFTDPFYKKFLDEDLIPGLAKRLAKKHVSGDRVSFSKTNNNVF